MAEEFAPRKPFVEKTISEISSSDSRVRVIGTVLDNQGNTVVIDDGSGQMEVKFEENKNAKGMVRVFGRVIPSDGGFEIQGDFIQDMSGMDHSMLENIRDLEKL